MAKKEFGGKTGRSGLPENVIIKDYPKCSHETSDLDDTITKIDETRSKSVSKVKGHKSKQH
jgi:hypothetical protein